MSLQKYINAFTQLKTEINLLNASISCQKYQENIENLNQIYQNTQQALIQQAHEIQERVKALNDIRDTYKEILGGIEQTISEQNALLDQCNDQSLDLIRNNLNNILDVLILLNQEKKGIPLF